jgi:8-oxo-dGTP pyrophosphatase MutT (NUDIX family)
MTDNTVLAEKHVVTCFLEHDDRILILKRSKKVGTYQNSWAGVSGYMDSSDLEQAFTEINEETGLEKDEVKLIRRGRPLEIIDNRLARKWVIHPFLFHVKAPESIKLDWEHTEMRWIKPEELHRYQTVPGLKEALDLVIR